MAEYPSGLGLSERLEHYLTFSEDQAKLIAAEILLALEFLHERKLFCRDLRTENISLDKDGHAKLIDLGISLGLSCPANTFRDMSPEVLAGQPYTPAADLWSFGLLLHEMLFGFVYYDTLQISRLLNKVLNLY